MFSIGLSNIGTPVQYRARKQAADSPVGRLLTRAVLYRSCVARFSQESDQERGASKQLAPGVTYTHLQTNLTRRNNVDTSSITSIHLRYRRSEGPSGGRCLEFP